MVMSRLTRVREVEHCWIPVSGGVRLSARLWLPETRPGEANPAVLEYIPYRKRDMVRIRDERNHAFLARHGYACVRVDMRGSGDSEGLMTDMYRPEEQDDAIEVIEWIATQPWCDGAVGMMGTSWGGTASLQAALRRPEALGAIIAVCATDNRFDDDIHHMGGCLLTDSVEWGATLPAILASPPDPATVGGEWRRMWRERLEGASFPLENWIRHETRDDYWRFGSVNESPGGIACPALLVGGWSDRYSATVMNLLAANRGCCWGIVGPWGHHYPDLGSPGPGIGFQQEALRWWDRWLRGVENGVAREPRLRVWMQEHAPPGDRLERRPGRWVSEREWPSPRVTQQNLPLGRNAALRPRAEVGPDCAVVPTHPGIGVASGDTGYFGREGGLPLDQRADDTRSLVFETKPLVEALEILGSARFEVSLECDQPVATLAARVNDVHLEGAVARVVWTVRNLNLALDDSGRTPSRLVPGEARAVSIVFPSTAHRFRAGHRIRLSLSCAYWPLVWPAPRPARLVLHLRDARLVLPVRGNTAEEAPVGFGDPVEVKGPATRAVVPARPLVRHAESEGDDGVRSSGWHLPYRCTHFTEIDLDFGVETRAEYRMDMSDPDGVSARFEHRLHFARDGWAIDVTGIAELRSTASAYEVSGSLEARENGEPVFERKWKPAIPRTCS